MRGTTLQRILRDLADELGLTFVETTGGGRHNIMNFTRSDGSALKFAVPRGSISESGKIVDNLKRNLRHAAVKEMTR